MLFAKFAKIRCTQKLVFYSIQTVVDVYGMWVCWLHLYFAVGKIVRWLTYRWAQWRRLSEH